jgi:hypothetical protein
MSNDLHKEHEFVLNKTAVQRASTKINADYVRWNITKTHAFTCEGWKKVVCRQIYMGAVNIN